MNGFSLSTRAMILFMSAILFLMGGVAAAAKDKPMKPELAAKKENHRKQVEQRITPEKRKAGADALKAERLKIYQAKQAHKQQNNNDNVIK